MAYTIDLTPPEGAPLDLAFDAIRTKLVEASELCSSAARYTDFRGIHEELRRTEYRIDDALRTLQRAIALAEDLARDYNPGKRLT